MAKQSQAQTTKPRKSATKTEKIVRFLKRPSGATIVELQKATEWQAHSVRGFLSGTIKKQMKFEVSSEKDEDGERRYRIREEVEG